MGNHKVEIGGRKRQFPERVVVACVCVRWGGEAVPGGKEREVRKTKQCIFIEQTVG